MAQTRREKKSEETGALWLAVMREMLRGSGVAVAVTLLALLACALLVSNGTIGEEMMDRAVLAVCVLGSLTGGLTAVRRIRRSPRQWGLEWEAVCSCCCCRRDACSPAPPLYPMTGP